MVGRLGLVRNMRLAPNGPVKAEYLRVMLGDTTANVPIDQFFGPGSMGSLKVSQNIESSGAFL